MSNLGICSGFLVLVIVVSSSWYTALYSISFHPYLVGDSGNRGVTPHLCGYFLANFGCPLALTPKLDPAPLLIFKLSRVSWASFIFCCNHSRSFLAFLSWICHIFSSTWLTFLLVNTIVVFFGLSLFKWRTALVMIKQGEE